MVSIQVKSDIFFELQANKLQCYEQLTKRFLSVSKNDLRTYDNIQKIDTGQGDDLRLVVY